MPVRSAVLGRATVGAPGPAVVLFTVPAGHLYLVKDVEIYNASGAANTGGVQCISAVGGIGVFLLFKAYAIAEFGQWSGFFVMSPGDFMRVSGTAGFMNAWASGADLVP